MQNVDQLFFQRVKFVFHYKSLRKIWSLQSFPHTRRYFLRTHRHMVCGERRHILLLQLY